MSIGEAIPYVVGGAGIAGFVASQLDRRHATKEARAARLFAARARAYQALIVWILKHEKAVNDEAAHGGGRVEMTDEEWMGVASEVAAFGTDAIDKAQREFRARFDKFVAAASSYSTIAKTTVATLGPSGPSLAARQTMLDAQTEVQKQATLVQGLVRSELAAL